MSGNPARSSAAHLRAWGRDWDGSPMPEDAEPMPGLRVARWIERYGATMTVERLSATQHASKGPVDEFHTPGPPPRTPGSQRCMSPIERLARRICWLEFTVRPKGQTEARYWRGVSPEKKREYTEAAEWFVWMNRRLDETQSSAGIKRPSTFRKPPGMKFDWSKGRYIKDGDAA